MELSQRIVKYIPLEEIWNESEIVSQQRMEYLTEKEIVALLKQNKVQFVVANLGFQLDWISIDNCFSFFKSEVKGKISNEKNIILENYFEEYCFLASKWETSKKFPIVLLEKYH